MLSVITTCALIAAVGNCASKFFNDWSQQKMAAFQDNLKKKNMDDALRNNQIICSERLKCEKDFHKFMLAQMKDSNAANLHIIAEQSEAYQKWPLTKPPISLRNSQLLLADDDAAIPCTSPLFIVLAPGSDTALNKMLPQLERTLSDFASASLTSLTRHNVVVLADCWKNKMAECDEIVCRNIHSFIPDVPMVILSPASTNEGIAFDLSFWNITRDYSNMAYTYSFGNIVKIEGVDPIMPDCDIIADDLKAIITMLSDIYSWNSAHAAPQLLKLAKDGLLEMSEESVLAYYSEYVKILADMTAHGILDFDKECDDIIGFCQAIDRPVGLNNAFDATGYLSLDKGSLLPYLQLSTQTSVWEYFAEIHPYANSTHNKKYRSLMLEWFDKCIEESIPSESFLEYESLSDNFFKSIVDSEKSPIISYAGSVKTDCIERVRRTGDYTDRRDWIRPELHKGILAKLESYVMPQMLTKVANRIIDRYKAQLSSAINHCAESFNYPLIDKSMALTRAQEIVKSYMEKFKDQVKKADKTDIYRDLNRIGTYEWSNRIANDWIEYVFLGTDLVHTARYIGIKTSLEEDNLIFPVIESRLGELLKSYAQNIFNHNSGSYSSGDSSDSSSDTFFDYVVMSPSF